LDSIGRNENASGLAVAIIMPYLSMRYVTSSLVGEKPRVGSKHALTVNDD
jgi:hypothetical protein